MFFGFGYTMGRKSTQSGGAADNAAPPAPTSLFGGAKPAAGSPAASSNPTLADSLPVSTPATQTAPATDPAATSAPAASTSTVSPADRKIAGDPPQADKSAAVIPQPAATSQPPPPGSFMVQIAAVSSQEVADILLTSLEKKGYNVAAHREPTDQLLHIQIGPFTNRKDAEAMRQRVIADGFNAIVK